MEEIPLSGGRVTSGVVRIGDTVRRPLCQNSEFVHRVLRFLEPSGLPVARFLGIDEKGREILSFLPGKAPDNLGKFSLGQLKAAARIIRRLHDALRFFPGCASGQTVCHHDLSPCNFLFVEQQPAFVIDWDACAIGDPIDDLAYALWMWLDVGNPDFSPTEILERMEYMLDAYQLEPERRIGLSLRMERQMDRVSRSLFPSPEQTKATQCWAKDCRQWLRDAALPY